MKRKNVEILAKKIGFDFTKKSIADFVDGKIYRWHIREDARIVNSYETLKEAHKDLIWRKNLKEDLKQ